MQGLAKNKPKSMTCWQQLPQQLPQQQQGLLLVGVDTDAWIK